MHDQDLAKISSSHHHPAHPLTRRVHRPRGLPSPTCQPQGCALPLSPLPRSGSRLDRPPRSPPLLSALPTKPPHASLSLIFVESPGEPATSLLHHRHQSTPQPVLATSFWTRPRSPPYAHLRSNSTMHSSSALPHDPSGAAPLPLSPIKPPWLSSNTCARRRDRTVGTTVSAPLDTRMLPNTALHARLDPARRCHRPSQPVDAQDATTTPAGHQGLRAR
jgi:hypothetical protein